MTIANFYIRKFATYSQIRMTMYINRLFLLIFSVFLLQSCEKKEQPYPMPAQPELNDSTIETQLEIGSSYAKQIFYSLKNGIIKSNEYASWDISFTTKKDSTEMWLNGGKLNLVYVTDATQFGQINSSYTFESSKWKYDKTSGLSGASALGFLENSTYLGKVLIISAGQAKYKLLIKSITDNAVEIEVATDMNATSGTAYTLLKDEDYNYVYVNLATGIVDVEPKKNEWDILFTRYRYIYEKYNPDGSDFLYGVTGVLINPYNTLGASDSTKSFDYFEFDKTTHEEHYNLVPNRDVIGFNWKVVDINTAKYKTLPNRIFVIKDQEDILWKLHFITYTNSLGENGYPKFRYERLK